MNKKMTFLAALVLSLSLALSGCGNNGDKSSAETKSTEQGQAASSGESKQEESKQESSEAPKQESSAQKSEESKAPETGELTPDQLIQKVEAYYANMKSLSMSMNMNIMGMDTTADMKVDKDGNCIMKLGVMGMEMHQYLKANGDGTMTSYTSDPQNPGKWTKTTTEKQDQFNSVEDYSQYLPNLKLSKDGGDYVLQGDIDFSKIKDNPTLGGSLPQDGTLAMLDGMKVPMRFVIDGKDFHYKEVSMDLSAVLNKALSQEDSSVPENVKDMLEKGLSITIRDIVADNENMVTIPEDVINNAQ